MLVSPEKKKGEDRGHVDRYCGESSARRCCGPMRKMGMRPSRARDTCGDVLLGSWLVGEGEPD